MIVHKPGLLCPICNKHSKFNYYNSFNLLKYFECNYCDIYFAFSLFPNKYYLTFKCDELNNDNIKYIQIDTDKKEISLKYISQIIQFKFNYFTVKEILNKLKYNLLLL